LLTETNLEPAALEQSTAYALLLLFYSFIFISAA